MKKILKFLIAAVPILLILFIVTVSIVNDCTASRLEKELAALPLPEGTEYIETVSAAGKLSGNGNGMQFFGGMLIKSELSAEELEEYYSAYRDNDWEYLVKKQSGKEITLIEHGSLEFTAEFSDEDSYYIVYTWASGIEPFASLDMRGH